MVHHRNPGERGKRSPAGPSGVALGAGIAGVAAAAVLVALSAGPVRVGPPRLASDGDLPSRGRLLWLDGRPTVPGPGAVAARDSAGRVLLADDALRIREAMLPGEVASAISAAPAPGDGIWVVDGRGRLLRLAADGTVAAEVPTPYVIPALGGFGSDGVLAVTRSPEGFPFVLDTMPETPVALLDTAGRPVARFGTAVEPEQPLLADLANAGHVLRAGERVVFAPFVRDEVIAFGPRGDTVWTLRRGLAHATPEPRFVVRDGRPVLDYFPVNLGLGLGPDGRLYVLSTADSTLERARLDVIAPASGHVLATFSLTTVFPTVVVTRRGAVHVVASKALLARAKDAARPPAPRFDWPRLGAGRVTQADLLGRVTIVNAWASWCAPCREEMPALVALGRTLADSGLALLAVNEDVRVEDARRWLAENDLAPPVALARGKARLTFGYPGLPYTMLVDRDGRIVRRWIGYLGPSQIATLEAAARRELGLAPATGVGGPAPHHHGHPEH
jgi:cytochrome c biogenesis protein CcmG/thiol:disulfide interchange protein DsbE